MQHVRFTQATEIVVALNSNGVKATCCYVTAVCNMLVHDGPPTMCNKCSLNNYGTATMNFDEWLRTNNLDTGISNFMEFVDMIIDNGHLP